MLSEKRFKRSFPAFPERFLPSHAMASGWLTPTSITHCGAVASMDPMPSDLLADQWRWSSLRGLQMELRWLLWEENRGGSGESILSDAMAETRARHRSATTARERRRGLQMVVSSYMATWIVSRPRAAG